MKKRRISGIAMLLSLSLLSSCASTYSAKINAGDGSGEWLPPVSGNFGDQLGQGGGKEDFFEQFGDFSAEHLFSQNGFDSSLLAGLAGLAGMGDTVEKLKDFSGFTQGDAYFIADFDANPSKYSGAGKFLFAKNSVLSEEERLARLKELGAEDVILAAYEADGQGIPQELYAVYPKDKELKQIYVTRKNPETGAQEMLLYDYVSTPVNGELPVLPGEEIPDLSDAQPKVRYSTEWLEWLISKDKGTIYPMVKDGELYTSRYEQDTRYTPSPWSIRQEGIVARFALSLGLDSAQFPYVDERGEKYRWRVFYRDDRGEFLTTESSHPWRASLSGEKYRLELDLFNYGMELYLKDDVLNNVYQTVFIVEDLQGRILCWYADDVDWTDSSEAYYAHAVEAGIQVDYRQRTPVVDPNKEPQNPFAGSWLDWLVDTDKGNTYPQTGLEPAKGTFAASLAPSAFLIWPYDAVTDSVYKNSRFGIALTMDITEGDFTESLGGDGVYPYRWDFGYRQAGGQDFTYLANVSHICKPYGYAVYGDSCVYYLDVLNYGFRPTLQDDGSPTAYELVFVIRDRNDASRVIGWQVVTVEWNASAQAYYDKAVELGVQEDVLG